MDSQQLTDMFAAVERQHIRLHSLLIVRNGYVVVEAYYPPYTPETRHTVQSITKSVIGSLIGIAIDQGKLNGVQDSLVSFFPDRSMDRLDARKASITLGNLLSMTGGLDCEDGTRAADGMYQSNDWVQYLLDLPMKNTPGEQWAYCSGSSHLLSAVLQQAAGMDARTYANKHLFAPLEIPTVMEQDWGYDPQGVTDGIAGLYLTPRELAKYGYLYLNEGKWEGQQVIPRAWVRASTRPQIPIESDAFMGDVERDFGYMFSVFPKGEYYGYLGRAGQELYVMPRQNLVVVFTASLRVGDEPRLLDLLQDYIIPAVRSNSPIPVNQAGAARLNGYARAASQPVPQSSALPKIAAEISGKTYMLEPNPMGWGSMTFAFKPGSDEGSLRIAGASPLKIGLDNLYRLNSGGAARPVGLRGKWTGDRTFHLDYIVLGEFTEAEADVEFDSAKIEISLINLNFGGPALILHGEALQ